MPCWFIKYEARRSGAIGTYSPLKGFAFGNTNLEALEAFRKANYDQWDFGMPITCHQVEDKDGAPVGDVELCDRCTGVRFPVELHEYHCSLNPNK